MTKTQPSSLPTFDLSNFTTTSSKIRFLTSQNLTRSQIAKVLNIKYQWVRNVQITPLKKN